VEASNGKLYGMTSFGAPGNYGLLYEYDISGMGTYTAKVNFQHTTERNPEGSLIETSPGILYGLSKSGGATGHGTICRYDISADTTSVEYDLNNTPSGREPTGDLMKASNGKLYGMTPKGGGSNGT